MKTARGSKLQNAYKAVEEKRLCRYGGDHFEWVKELRTRNLRVSRTMTIDYAKSYYQEHALPGFFKASGIRDGYLFDGKQQFVNLPQQIVCQSYHSFVI